MAFDENGGKDLRKSLLNLNETILADPLEQEGVDSWLGHRCRCLCESCWGCMILCGTATASHLES